MTIFRKVSVQTFWQLLGKVSASLSTVFVLATVSRNFGTSGIGELTLALVYLGVFYGLIDLGINAYILPELVLGNHQIIWRKLLGLRLFLAFWLILLSLLILPFIPGASFNFLSLVRIGVFSIIPLSILSASSALFQSKLQYKHNALAIIIGSLITVSVVFVLSLTNSPIFTIILGYVLGNLVASLISLNFIFPQLKNILPIFDFEFIKKMAISAAPISATLFFNTLYFRIDTFILKGYASFAQVGIYNFAYQLFQTALVLPTFIMNGFYPIMIKQFAQNPAKFRKSFFNALFIMLTLGAFTLLFSFILAPFIVKLLTGSEKFNESVKVLRILSLGFPAFFVSSLTLWALVVLKKFSSLFLIYFVGFLINILFNLNLIPQYSYYGASWVTTAGEYLILLPQLLILYTHFKNK